MTFDEKPIYLNATSINSTEKVRPMSINERLTSEEYFEQYIKSEHYINNEQYDGELHLVHQNQETKQYLVIAILIKQVQSPHFQYSWFNYLSAPQSINKNSNR